MAIAMSGPLPFVPFIVFALKTIDMSRAYSMYEPIQICNNNVQSTGSAQLLLLAHDFEIKAINFTIKIDCAFKYGAQMNSYL